MCLALCNWRRVADIVVGKQSREPGDMAAEFQIVEHKDCLRCFQPIDQRAMVCPFCQSSQKKPTSRLHSFLLSLLNPAAVVLTFAFAGCAAYFWFSFDSERDSGLELARDLATAQRELDVIRSDSEAQRLSSEESARLRLDLVKGELEVLISHIGSTANLVATFCNEESILSVCLEASKGTSEDSIALARLMGRFEALGSGAAFCDRMRPVVENLNRRASSRTGANMRDSYYLATANCWQSAQGIEGD